MEECNQTALGPVGGEDGVIGQCLRVGGGVDPCLKVEEGDPLVHVNDEGDFSVNVLFTVHLLAGLEMIVIGSPAREMSSGGC